MDTPQPFFDRHKIHYALFLWVALSTFVLILWAGKRYVAPSPNMGIELLGDGHIYEVDPEGPASRIALREGDRVLAVDGVPLYREAVLFTGKSVGDVVTLRVQRGGAVRDVPITLGRITRGASVLHLELLLVGIVFWIVGVLVWMLRPASPVTRLFFIVSQVVAIRLLAELLDPVVPGAMLLSDTLKVLLGPVVLHFYATFPTTLPHRMRRRLLGVAYGSFALLALLALAAPRWVSTPAESALLWTVLRSFEVFFLLIAVAVLFRPHGAVPLQTRRRRRVLIAGMLLGLFPVLLMTLVPGLLAGDPLLPYTWTLPCAALVPLVYAYAVYQGELGQVDWLMNRSLVYFLLTMLLLAFYLLLFFGLDRTLAAERTWRHLLAGAVLVVVTSAFFAPLRARLQQWVDRLFYGGWYDYRTLVQEVSTDLSRTVDLQDLVGRLKDAAVTMRFQAGAFLWRSGSTLSLQGSYGYEQEALAQMCLPVEGALGKLLREVERPCTRRALRDMLAGSALTETERLLLSHPHPEYWVPLVCHGILHGVMVVRRHQGEEALDAEDLAIVSTLAAQAAVACENISLLESLRARLKEAEQVRLARELHDGPVQDLYAMAHGLEGLLRSMPDPTGAHRVGALRESLQEVAGTLRDICMELRPPLLADFGLGTALRSHAARFLDKHPGTTLHLDLPSTEQGLPEGVQLALFRIYQESLRNAAQHGHAQNVWVRLTEEAGQVVLSVEDDGAGFVVPARWIELGRLGHLGLLGISERAESLGGRLQVHSEPGQGTRLRVVVPGPLEKPVRLESTLLTR